MISLQTDTGIPVNKPVSTTVPPAPTRRNSQQGRSPFCRPFDYLANRYVYVVLSPRARGLSVGVNMNPDKFCNFDCAYCEVDRRGEGVKKALEVDVMARELRTTIDQIRSGQIREHASFRNLPGDLLQLRHVALSGEGEPTLSPFFGEALQEVVHVRASGAAHHFKIVLVTNTTGLDRPEVQSHLGLLTNQDEIWAKLDAGTQAYMERVNRTPVTLAKVLENILWLGRRRPVVIQSLFPAWPDGDTSAEEINQYALNLLHLKEQGAQISLVQLYSATRPMARPEVGHLPLRNLFAMAAHVRKTTGLRVEVF